MKRKTIYNIFMETMLYVLCIYLVIACVFKFMWGGELGYETSSLFLWNSMEAIIKESIFVTYIIIFIKIKK